MEWLIEHVPTPDICFVRRTREANDAKKCIPCITIPHTLPLLLPVLSRPCSISLTSPLLSTPWLRRGLMFCFKKERTLFTRASKISTASPLLLCMLSICHCLSYRDIHLGKLTFSSASRCGPGPPFLIPDLILLCSCSGRSYAKYTVTTPA